MWRAMYYDADGKQKNITAGCRDRVHANKFLVDLLGKVTRDEPIESPAKRISFSELYKRLREYKLGRKGYIPTTLKVWKYMEPFFGNMLVNRLTSVAVDEFVSQLRSRNLAPATINRRCI